MQTTQPPSLPKAFFWRRLHSLTGVFLVLFLCEHLLTNSQAALFLGDDGSGFIRAVNFIHSLPYLPAIEIGLLGVPILIHAVWGLRYLFDSEPDSWPSTGARPSLGYARNHAYTWQRITSWLLLIGILAHVVQMRFIRYPEEAVKDGAHQYMVRVEMDEGLYTLADRLGVALYDNETLKKAKATIPERSVVESVGGGILDNARRQELLKAQDKRLHEEWVAAMSSFELSENEVIAVSPKMGTAILLNIRDTLKYPSMLVLYSIFVLAASFHAFNGLWTACITWGISLTPRSQQILKSATVGLMLLVMLLGLSAVWATYWVNLYQ